MKNQKKDSRKTETQQIPVIAVRKRNTNANGVGLSHYVPMPSKKNASR